MPKGPNGVKRPADTNASAVMVGKIATGEIEDTPTKQPNKQKSGLAGAAARKAALTKKERSEIAKKAAAARWNDA